MLCYNLSILKHFLLFFICSLLFYQQLHATVDTVEFNPAAPPVALRSHFAVLEDVAGIHTPETLFANPVLFSPIKNFKVQQAGSVFWLYTHIQSAGDADIALSFKHLTDCDLYIIPGKPGLPYTHRRAGSFTAAEQLTPGDSRFHFQLRLEAGITYKILLRSHHSKQYKPVFDFELDDLHHFTKAKQRKELIDFWFQGAALVLLLYALISWFTTHYKPYLWMAIFITGFTLYNLALSRYLIDWFFPSHPLPGWRLTIHFLHLGLVGFYLLLLDFWKVKEKNKGLYLIGKGILYCIIVLSALSFLIHYYTSNFRLMSQVNGGFFIVQVTYLVYLLLLWKGFDKPERFLAYGVILYLSVAFFVTMALFIVGEQVFSFFAVLSGSLLVTISLLFLTGINGKLWQNEKDKTLYQAQLTQLQQQQNQLLEASVTERTRELNQRNQHIELLMNELNHRVKNNLQLLYSLNSLQLAGNSNVYASNLLKDNVARINAMMLVNNSLSPGNNNHNKTISPTGYIADIAAHSQKMFARTVAVDVKIEIDDTLILDAASGVCLGLIVAELLTNSYKHAFAAQPQPKIGIRILCSGNQWQMHYNDNGQGMSNPRGNSFGLTLIADLTRQLKGGYKLLEGNGVHYLFNFPNPV